MRGSGSGPGARVAGGGEPTRDSTPVKGDDSLRGLNRQKSSSVDPHYGVVEGPNREKGDGQSGNRGGAMPASTGGTVRGIKLRDSSPPKSERFDTTYRIQPPAPKPPTVSAASRPVTVNLSRDEINAAIEMFAPLGYDRERAIKTYARHKAEIQGKK